MITALDSQMEQASEALARMDYLACEALCEPALAEAKRQGDWAYYGRILLPLQECRRQRRMIAAEGIIRLGTSAEGGGSTTWLNHLESGCIIITHPHTPRDAARLLRECRERKLFVEVLFADNHVTDATWRIRSFNGPAMNINLPGPAAPLRDRWILPRQKSDSAEPTSGQCSTEGNPADWFIHASEKLGDALLASVKATSPADRVDALEACLLAAPDHEILHQRLADAAKAARMAKA